MKRSRAGLEPLLLQHGTFAEVQPSPDLAELLYWNVVVSFVVSVVANAAYDGLVYIKLIESITHLQQWLWKKSVIFMEL